MARKRSEDPSEDLIPYNGAFEANDKTFYVKGVMSEAPIGEVPPIEPPEDIKGYMTPVRHEDAKNGLSLDLHLPNHIIEVAGHLVLPAPVYPPGQSGHIEIHNPDGHEVALQSDVWIGVAGPIVVGKGKTLIPYYAGEFGVQCSAYEIKV